MKTNIDIVTFTIDLYDEVFALWSGCDGIGLSAADSRDQLELYLKRNPAMSFVAKDQTRVVGALLAGHDGRRGYLHHLAVNEAHRKSGLGRQLVAKSLAALVQAGIGKSHIFLFHDNEEGEKFWRSIGWEKRQDLKIFSRLS